MKTQAEINALLDQFRGKYAGQYADYVGYKGECLSLVKRWVDTVAGKTVAPAAGGWGDYYWKNFPLPLTDYFVKENFVAGKDYPTGSLVTYAATHHIAIWAGNGDQGNHMVFEQNADPDGSPAHIAARADSRATGILVIKTATPTTPPSSGQHPYQWAVGKRAHLSASVATWRVYYPGTTKEVGKLRPKANGGLDYIVRAVDPGMYNRVLVRSAEFGPKGKDGLVSLPLDADATIK